MERVYIVTLWKHEDLEGFYQEMEALSIELHTKREISRNTYYRMTDAQAESLKDDSRVRYVGLHPEELGVVYRPALDPYELTNQDFYKDDEQSPANSGLYRDWGKLFCAGTEAQRRKGDWGSNGFPQDRTITDTVSIFGDGKDVDIVVVDDPISHDCEEWFSPSTGQTRFVQYDWYTNLRQYVPAVPNIPFPAYKTNDTNPDFHGIHVMSTAGGQHYGWAREANLYGLGYLELQDPDRPDHIDQGTVFDLLRAFHKHKPLNPTTGRRNPTITNHSYGASYGGRAFLNCYPNNLSSFEKAGVTHNAGNPPPEGWNSRGVCMDLDVDTNNRNENAFDPSVTSDLEDCIADGVVLIGAAGNNNYYIVDETHSEYDDFGTWDYNNWRSTGMQGLPLDSFAIWTKRGSSPVANGMISVGNINQDRFNRRNRDSNFGPGIDLWAPGSFIIGAFNRFGTQDPKYGGNNYYAAISGTSMASPQVCGVAACLASGKDRFTQDDMLNYIEQYSWDIGSDGNPELSFDGADNGGEGHYIRDFVNASTAGLPSQRRFFMALNPTIAGTSEVKISAMSIHRSINNTSLYPADVYSFFSSDRWQGWLSRESTEDALPGQRVINLWEGDALEVSFPNKYCMFNLASSNTANGWTFSKPVRVPSDPNDPANATIPDTGDLYDRTGGRNYVAGVTGNPTINVVQGDILVIDTGAANTAHPFWIKSTQTPGNQDALTGFFMLNNGGQGEVLPYPNGPGTGTYMSGLRNGQIILHTQHIAAGTYYYQCGNHASMSGEIVVHDPAVAFANKGFYFKTAQSVDTTSDLVQGQQANAMQGQGNTTWPVDDADIMRWQTRPGDIGTFYLQSGFEAFSWEINVVAYPAAGTFNDFSCNKDGPTRFLRAMNPRPTDGVTGPMPVGRKNNPDHVMKYPRTQTLVRAIP